MLLIGHRGCHYPGFNQNTLRAFEKVTAEGVAAIEFDVQLCADDKLVVVHNLDLEEVSNGHGKVSATDSATLKSLYAGNMSRGHDRIPFLYEVFDFFSSLSPTKRPAIHLELKGDGSGSHTGQLMTEYLQSAKLTLSDFLVSSFNWQELEALRAICQSVDIALLEGAIRRDSLLMKVGEKSEQYFESIFAYGSEQYMLPRFQEISENVALVRQQCPDPFVQKILVEEIESCLAGNYYTDKLLDKACEMKAHSVNLWHQTISQSFVNKIHQRGLAIYVYTVNDPSRLKELAHMGVDGIFTDFYTEAAQLLADYL